MYVQMLQMRMFYDSDDEIDKLLASRDPYYWPSPAWIAANAHFRRRWAEWRAAPPAWLSEEWKRDLPPEYYEAFFGEERVEQWRAGARAGGEGVVVIIAGVKRAGRVVMGL